MSKAYVIDKDGIIIEEVYVICAHHTPKGKMIKPKSDAEDRMLVEFSNLQKKIKALTEEMKQLEVQMIKEAEVNDAYTQKVEELFEKLQGQEHECYIPGQLVALMEQWQQNSAALSGEAYAAEAARIRRKGLGLMEVLQQKKLEHLTGRAALMARVASLQEEIWEQSNLEIQIETDAGMESWEAEIDQRTKGALTGMKQELDAISARISTADPAQVLADDRLLEAMEERLSTLPDAARRIFAQQVSREEEMERIAQRLEKNGWELLELQRGESLHDDCSLFIQGAGQKKAAIRFQLDGKVEIISHFQEDAFRSRERLQQLVLETIRENGEKAKGTCMDGQPQTGAAEQQTVPQTNPDTPDPVAVARQTSTVQQNRGVEKA